MKWTVSLPRAVAEDDKAYVHVENDTIEGAIIDAAHILHDGGPPRVGQIYLISARVRVCAPTTLPLKSV